MREIKFRVWSKTLRRYVLPSLGTNDGTLRICTVLKGDSNNPEDYVIEQYTGLKDRNGKEIYEGDIVEFGLSGRPERGYVAYADEYASFEVYSKRNFIFGGLFGHAGKAIGNIHENGELLKEA